MEAVNFVESYKNYAIDTLLNSFLWFLAIVLLSAAAYGLTRSLELIASKCGTLIMFSIALGVAVICGLFHFEKLLLGMAKRFLLGH
jgi:hypothetical protein